MKPEQELARLKELARQVRAAQKAYFRMRTPDLLRVSKKLEADLDELLAEKPKAPSLFDPSPELTSEG